MYGPRLKYHASSLPAINFSTSENTQKSELGHLQREIPLYVLSIESKVFCIVQKRINGLSQKVLKF
jgi:hypothetical protein